MKRVWGGFATCFPNCKKLLNKKVFYKFIKRFKFHYNGDNDMFYGSQKQNNPAPVIEDV